MVTEEADPREGLCITDPKHGPSVSGGAYCEDCVLNQQVKHHHQHTAPGGTLAQLIRNAKNKGLIAPVASGYTSAG